MFRTNFAIAVKVYFAHFLKMKMVGKLKSRGIAFNQVFVSKVHFFSHQMTKLIHGLKCAHNQTLDMNWVKIASEYCNLALISSLEQKTSNIQCKI